MDSVIHEIAWLFSARYLVSDVRSRPSTVRTDYVMKVGFSATVGEGPEKELTCVMVPIRTENALRFSARLDDGAQEVRFEWVVHS